MRKSVTYPLVGYYSNINGVRTEESKRLDSLEDVVTFICERAKSGSCLITDMLDCPVLIVNDKWITGICDKQFSKQVISELSKLEVEVEISKGENENEIL